MQTKQYKTPKEETVEERCQLKQKIRWLKSENQTSSLKLRLVSSWGESQVDPVAPDDLGNMCFWTYHQSSHSTDEKRMRF